MKSILIVILALAAFTFVGCNRAPSAKSDSPVITTKTGVVEMSPEQVRPAVEAAYAQFIDVRTPEEYASGHAYRAKNIPLDQLSANLDKLEKNEPVYLICHSGNRSKKAAQQLVDAGFPQAISVTGGTEAWKSAGLPMAQ
jgi:rhodanese-related sulfurtransferase